MGPQAMNQQDPDRQDLRDQFQVAMTRLDAIVTDHPTYTAAQARDAVGDLARIQRRAMRVLAYFVGLK